MAIKPMICRYLVSTLEFTEPTNREWVPKAEVLMYKRARAKHFTHKGDDTHRLCRRNWSVEMMNRWPALDIQYSEAMTFTKDDIVISACTLVPGRPFGIQNGTWGRDDRLSRLIDWSPRRVQVLRLQENLREKLNQEFQSVRYNFRSPKTWK